MRLLQVMGSARPGGAEGFFTRLCLGLAECGVDQRLVIRSNADCLKDLVDGGLSPIELPFLTSFDQYTRSRLKECIEGYQPTIVMTWMNRATTLCPRGDFFHLARMGGYYTLKYYSACDHIIGNTQDIVDYCRRGGWPVERTHYLPNFASEAKISASVSRAELGAPAGAPVLLALGRLHDDKAFDILIRSLAQLAGVQLWIAGIGPEQGSLRALAIKLRVDDRVRFLGWRNDTDSLLEAADCLVCPSRVEPLGNVILEAWARRRPVVAAASSGPAGLIDHGRTGLLAPVEDVDALASALRLVLGDKTFAKDLQDRGHQEYLAKFSRRAVLDRYLAFLSSFGPRPCAE